MAGDAVVLGAILAGGASRRMGQTKATLEIDGMKLAHRVARSLVGGGARSVVLVGSDPATSSALGLEVVDDRWPGSGPLAGLASVVSWAATDARAHRVVVVAACDQPDLSSDLVARELAALATAPHRTMGCVPMTPDGRRQPFPSAWRVEAAPMLVELVEAGQRRAAAASERPDVIEIDAQEHDLADLDLPEDLARRRAAATGPVEDPSG